MGTVLIALLLLTVSAGLSLGALAAARALDVDRRLEDLRSTLPSRAAALLVVLGWFGVALALAGFLGVIPGVPAADAAMPMFSIALLGMVMLTALRPGRTGRAATGLGASDSGERRRAA